MADRKWTDTHAARSKVLRRARDLARSGHHADHTTIIAQLGPVDANTLKALLVIRGQLNHLCALARSGAVRFDIPGRNQPATELPR
jgi:hypothetical protein